MTDLYVHNNHLIYRTPEPERITRYVASAKRINGSHVAVPINLYNLQLLRWLDYPVTEPMAGYDWPHSPEIDHPYATQKLQANFMVLHPKCFNLSDMGVGKSLSALWAADWMMLQHAPGMCRALIVTPLSTMQRVWGDAIFKNLMGRRTFQIVHAAASRRRDLLAEPADFYILNHDGVKVGAHMRRRLELGGLSKDLAEREDIKIVIVDEADVYREAQTGRHRVSRMVFGNRPYLWVMTGTPTPNGPLDAYGLAKLVNNARNESFTSYRNRTMMQIATHKWIPRANAMEDAHAMLTPAVRVAIEQVWDGPSISVQQREVPLTAAQDKALAELKRDLQVVVKSGQPITAVNEASARIKYLQVVLGAVYDADHRAHTLDASPRLKIADEVVASTSRKILIFVPFTSVVNLLHSHLTKKHICAVITGNVSAKERATIIQRFANDETLRVLIADPGTVAHGINELVAADTVLWYGPTDKTVLYLQGNKRAHRPGQRHPVTIVQLVATKLEREIFRRLETNESLQGLLLQMVKEGNA